MTDIIPNGYEQILTSIYGDYMKLPPENERFPHHYVEEIDFGSY